MSLSFRKTVEYRLHKVFTKLGIAGRLELAELGVTGERTDATGEVAEKADRMCSTHLIDSRVAQED